MTLRKFVFMTVIIGNKLMENKTKHELWIDKRILLIKFVKKIGG